MQTPERTDTTMTHEEIKELLEKQLQLLSERSEACYEAGDLPSITEAMIALATLIADRYGD